MINTIIQGHALNVLKTLPDESVNCCLTSPPYWGLRDYGIEPVIWDGDKDCKHIWGNTLKGKQTGRNDTNDPTSTNFGGWSNWDGGKNDEKGQFCQKCGAWRGSLGLEPTFELYIKHLCNIFDEIKRALRKDGTCWVNLGDSYNSHTFGKSKLGGGLQKNLVQKNEAFPRYRKPPKNLGDKSLCLIPQRFAIEMVNRGWILRNIIIWHKPNCMPSSAKDRFTVDFEYVYFFTKSNKAQFWTNSKTGECVSKKPLGTKGIKGKDWEWQKKESSWQRPSRDETFKLPSRKKSTYAKEGYKKVSLWTGHDYWFEQQFEPHLTINEFNKRDMLKRKLNDSNKQYSKHSHGPQDYGINGRNKRAVWTIPTQPFPEAHFAVYPKKLIEPMIKAGCPKGGIVLDPFMGAGTTAVVAKKLGRNYMGIEIKQEYIDMANKRIRAIPELLF